ncbi:MAG: hypothetical protein CL824_00085 [Crocinitomicaceae bacterium]|nr:hypothetical protein [Crocinitomicaceae bacterium]
MIKTRLQLAISFVLLSFFSFSQANTLVVFAEDPTPFYVILDGVKKNEIAKTRVVIPGIEQTNSSVKIYFKDESIAPVSKNIWWENANHNDEVSFRLVNTKRGYKLRYFSTKQNAPVATEAAATPAAPVQNTQAQTQNVQSTTTTTVTETTTINNNSNSGNVDMNSNVNGGNISMNINMNDGMNQSTESENVSLNMNINVNDGNMNNANPDNVNMNIGMNINENTTTHSNPNNTNMNINMDMNENMTTNTSINSGQTDVTVNETVTTTVTTTTINEAPVSSAPVSMGGCVNPIQDMSNIMAAIEDASFDSDKMIVAKQATAKSCLTVDQIKQILEEFSFSKEKLEFAKYAYKRCYNPDDYYQVNSSFDFSSDKEKLNDFIESQH